MINYKFLKHWSDTKTIQAVLQFQLSGIVPVGGEVLNLASTTALKAHPLSAPFGGNCLATGNGVSLGQFEEYFIPGTNLSNGQIKSVNYATGSILAPGAAYPAVVVADIFQLFLIIKKYVDLG